MNELHLFAGAGGGILGGMLLGHTPVCAVEIEPYPRKVLLQRQRDGILPKFPIWDDIRTFDGTPWRGKVDVVCGGIPARTSVQREKEQALRVSEADFGVRWHGLSLKCVPGTYSLRTVHSLWEEDLPWSSVILPKWGMMRDGELWERTMPEHLTRETESGFWLTPTCMNIAPTEDRREKRQAFRKSIGRKDAAGGLAEQVATPKLWPTPRSCSAMAATITTESAYSENRFPNLETVVGRRTWPTPTCHTAKECDSPSEARRNEPTLTHQARGGDKTLPNKLNPEWVEWLMGWPITWTDSKPLETDKFRKWLDSHGRFYREGLTNE